MYVTGIVRCPVTISNTSVDQFGVYPFSKRVLNLLTCTLSPTLNFVRSRTPFDAEGEGGSFAANDKRVGGGHVNGSGVDRPMLALIVGAYERR